MQPFLDSTAVLEDGNELQKRMERDGYLFVRALLPADILESLRLKVLEIGSEVGWVRADTPLGEAVADLNSFCVEPEPQYMHVYNRMYCLREFHAIQHHPNLVGLFERMLCEVVMPPPAHYRADHFPPTGSLHDPAAPGFYPNSRRRRDLYGLVPVGHGAAGVGRFANCLRFASERRVRNSSSSWRRRSGGGRSSRRHLGE